ncbi:MAG: Arm DNA-binding domain-containing protein [Alistipes sp.]|jgi:site-specific recombinase xerD|uniref:Arm DNA-binding domain-containing protein n=2 Tax=Bacteroidia TaxID=200643 RepID=UPI00343F84AC
MVCPFSGGLHGFLALCVNRGVNRKPYGCHHFVICFKSKTLANGEHPLMLRITKDRKRSMKSLGLSVHPDHWDFNKNEPKLKCPNRTLINQVIIKSKLDWQKKLLEKQANEEEFTSDSLIKERNEEKQIKAQTR